MDIIFHYRNSRLVLHNDGIANKKDSKNDNLIKTKKYKSILNDYKKYIKGRNKRKYIQVKKEIELQNRQEELKKKFKKYRKKGFNYFEDFPKNEAIESHNIFIKHVLRNSNRTHRHVLNLIKLHKLFLGKFNMNYKDIKYKLSTSEKAYLNLFVDFIHNTTDRVNFLFDDYYKNFKKKKYFISMLSLRALLETLYFDNYITHKLFLYIKEKNINKFLDLFLRANFGGEESSMKVISSALHDKKLRKIIGKYRGKRIHINDALKYFDIKNLKSLINKYPKIALDTKNKSYKFFYTIQKSVYRKIKQNYFSFGHYKTGYHRLCEVIHPTAIFMHRHNDKENIPDFHWIAGRSLHPSFMQMIAFNSILKKEILNQVFLNKDKILEDLRKI
jgi:hypothetical protein